MKVIWAMILHGGVRLRLLAAFIPGSKKTSVASLAIKIKNIIAFPEADPYEDHKDFLEILQRHLDSILHKTWMNKSGKS